MYTVYTLYLYNIYIRCIYTYTQLPSHERVWLPHLQNGQRDRRGLLRQVALQDRPGKTYYSVTTIATTCYPTYFNTVFVCVCMCILLYAGYPQPVCRARRSAGLLRPGLCHQRPVQRHRHQGQCKSSRSILVMDMLFVSLHYSMLYRQQHLNLVTCKFILQHNAVIHLTSELCLTD